VRAVRIVAALLAVLGLGGCEYLWNLGNQAPLVRDVSELFGAHEITLEKPICNMIGTTRGATCELRLTADQVAAAVRGLGLTEMRAGRAASLGQAGCRLASADHSGAPVRGYESGRQPKASTLRNGAAFSYLRLYYRADTREVCLEVSYAYG